MPHGVCSGFCYTKLKQGRESWPVALGTALLSVCSCSHFPASALLSKLGGRWSASGALGAGSRSPQPAPLLGGCASNWSTFELKSPQATENNAVHDKSRKEDLPPAVRQESKIDPPIYVLIISWNVLNFFSCFFIVWFLYNPHRNQNSRIDCPNQNLKLFYWEEETLTTETIGWKLWETIGQKMKRKPKTFFKFEKCFRAEAGTLQGIGGGR